MPTLPVTSGTTEARRCGAQRHSRLVSPGIRSAVPDLRRLAWQIPPPQPAGRFREERREMDEQTRPIGISVLGVVGFIVGAWQLFLSMIALTYSSSMVMIGALSGVPPEYAPAYAS